MKTIETTVYSLAELKANYPSSYAKAFERFQREACKYEVPWSDEIFDSLKAIVSACGFTVRNWSLGDSSNRSNDITLAHDERLELSGPLSGPRALAFFAHVLMDKGYARPTFPGWKMKFPGVCGFTGYCADEDFAEDIWKELQSGETLQSAIEGQASTYAKLLDAEIEQAQSEEEFEAQADMNEWNFTEEGDIF